ncbi:MAG TPA: MFS transporter, partial [Polyangia bacterium]|nr:MFS transporter [Polyangia bacterium]
MTAPGLDGRLAALVVAVALGAARATPIVWMVAPLGGPRLSAVARAGLAILLAALAAPLLV